MIIWIILFLILWLNILLIYCLSYEKFKFVVNIGKLYFDFRENFIDVSHMTIMIVIVLSSFHAFVILLMDLMTPNQYLHIFFVRKTCI